MLPRMPHKRNPHTFPEKRLPVWKISWYGLEKQPSKLFSNLWWNTTTKSNLRRKGFVLAYDFQLYPKGKSGQGLKAGAGCRNWSRGHRQRLSLLRGLLSVLFYTPHGRAYRGGTADGGLGLPTSTVHQESAPQMCLQADQTEALSQGRAFLFPDDPTLCPVKNKTNQPNNNKKTNQRGNIDKLTFSSKTKLEVFLQKLQLTG